MSNNVNIDVTGGAVKEVLASEQAKNLTSPITKSIGQAVDDIFYLVFGGWLHERAEKSKLKRQKNIEDFKRKLNEDLTKIPEDNRVFPKEYIVGPALEASKYYFEETEIRDMFEKLIVNSMDNRKISKVLPCFTEIIKQMTPLDAQNLMLFNKKTIVPIAQYHITNKDETYNLIRTNVFLENTQCQDLDLQSVSLAGLNRLGLIDIFYDRYINFEPLYEAFEKTEEFVSLKTKTDKSNQVQNKEQKATVQKGEAILTPLGQAFIDVCLS